MSSCCWLWFLLTSFIRPFFNFPILIFIHSPLFFVFFQCNSFILCRNENTYLLVFCLYNLIINMNSTLFSQFMLSLKLINLLPATQNFVPTNSECSKKYIYNETKISSVLVWLIGFLWFCFVLFSIMWSPEKGLETDRIYVMSYPKK